MSHADTADTADSSDDDDSGDAPVRGRARMNNAAFLDGVNSVCVEVVEVAVLCCAVMLGCGDT